MERADLKIYVLLLEALRLQFSLGAGHGKTIQQIFMASATLRMFTPGFAMHNLQVSHA